MQFAPTKEKLIEYMRSLEIIDGHEHLRPESEIDYSASEDVFTLIKHYIKQDLFSAGMDWESGYDSVCEPYVEKPIFKSLFDRSIPLEKRWKIFKPYWERVRFGSYARAALITAKRVYGFEGINDKTYKPLSEAIAGINKPGMYKSLLCDMCNIKIVLTQCGKMVRDELLVPVVPGFQFTDIGSRKQIETIAEENFDAFPKTLDDYVNSLRKLYVKWKNEGMAGIKIASVCNVLPDKKSAESLYNEIIRGKEIPSIFTAVDSRRARGAPHSLANYLLHSILEIANQLGVAVAVHAGIWGDFREIDSKFMLTLAPAYPRIKFDLYHLGMPSIRDTIVIAKNFPNVFLNLCWSHIISQVQTQRGIDEILDQVPINKIIAFGGDYSSPDKVVGHLEMARENFAIVFAKRIERELMNIDEAKHILKLWFYDNPLNLYNLTV